MLDKVREIIRILVNDGFNLSVEAIDLLLSQATDEQGLALESGRDKLAEINLKLKQNLEEYVMRKINLVVDPASGRPKPITHIVNTFNTKTRIDRDISVAKASGDPNLIRICYVI